MKIYYPADADETWGEKKENVYDNIIVPALISSLQIIVCLCSQGSLTSTPDAESRKRQFQPNATEMRFNWLISHWLRPQTTTPKGDGDLHDEQQHISMTEQ